MNHVAIKLAILTCPVTRCGGGDKEKPCVSIEVNGATIIAE